MEVLGNWGVICIADEVQDDAEPYEAAVNGNCMTCQNPLGENTLVIMDGEGIKGIWCSGQCLKDIHAITFLQDVEVAIIESIESRRPSIDEQ